MKRWMQRGAAFGLALLMTAGAAGASASDALGWEIHTGRVPLSQGTELGKNIFWSDTYSDLRTEHYITYAPNENVTPTVAYGSKVLTRATLTSMAQGLESQGKRVVSGINGDFYVLATGAPSGFWSPTACCVPPSPTTSPGPSASAPTAPPLSAPPT